MANPQAENGHVDLAHEIIEALAKYRLSGQEWQCLLVVFRKTYGWKKLEDEISLSQFQRMTGLSRPGVVRALTKLVSKRVLDGTHLGTTHAKKYKFNKNYEQWSASTQKRTSGNFQLVPKRVPQLVPMQVTPLVPKRVHTKENSTKETLKETILPDWIDRDLWEAWLEVRKKKRAPNTEKALALNIKKLSKWRDSGQDVTAIISRSVENGYQGLFEIQGGNHAGLQKPSGGGRSGMEAKSFHKQDVDEQQRIKDSVRSFLGVSGGGVGVHSGEGKQKVLDGRREASCPSGSVEIPGVEATKGR